MSNYQKVSQRRCQRQGCQPLWAHFWLWESNSCCSRICVLLRPRCCDMPRKIIQSTWKQLAHKSGWFPVSKMFFFSPWTWTSGLVGEFCMCKSSSHFPFSLFLHSGKLTYLWKIAIFNENTHYFNGHFSIAILT